MTATNDTGHNENFLQSGPFSLAMFESHATKMILDFLFCFQLLGLS